jgi:hypothetical protein
MVQMPEEANRAIGAGPMIAQSVAAILADHVTLRRRHRFANSQDEVSPERRMPYWSPKITAGNSCFVLSNDHPGLSGAELIRFPSEKR